MTKKLRRGEKVFDCPSCGTETHGVFCRKCGERAVEDGEYSLHGYVKELLAAITLLESKVLRSVWLLVSRPGYLSTEYFRGRRVRYMKPIQLFVFLNIVYYFSLSWFSATTFTTPLATQLHGNNYYSGYASRRVDRQLEQSHMTYDVLANKYDATSSVLSKTLIFLLIPMFSLLFYAFFFANRAYFVEHLVVATHFWSFSLLLLGILLPAFSLLLIRPATALGLSNWYAAHDVVITTVLQVCYAAYLYAMLRRAYGARRWYCAATSVAMAWSFFQIVWLYRFILFEVTMRVV